MFRVQDDSGLTEKMNEKWEQSENKTIETRPDMIRERNDITRELSITEKVRPQWDVDMLLRLGFDQVSVDMKIASEMYKGYYGPVSDRPRDPNEPDPRIFCVKGIKT